MFRGDVFYYELSPSQAKDIAEKAKQNVALQRKLANVWGKFVRFSDALDELAAAAGIDLRSESVDETARSWQEVAMATPDSV